MNRRTFLSWSTGGLAALFTAAAAAAGGMLRFLSPSVYYEPPQRFKIGNPGDFPFGPPTFLPDERIFVFRDKDKGFSVASAVCTHLGCTVQHFTTDNQFHCPCHGSVFSADGDVVHGPAPRSLEWFEVTMSRGGELTVDKSRVVPSAYHLMVKV